MLLEFVVVFVVVFAVVFAVVFVEPVYILEILFELIGLIIELLVVV